MVRLNHLYNAILYRTKAERASGKYQQIKIIFLLMLYFVPCPLLLVLPDFGHGNIYEGKLKKFGHQKKVCLIALLLHMALNRRNRPGRTQKSRFRPVVAKQSFQADRRGRVATCRK